MFNQALLRLLVFVCIMTLLPVVLFQGFIVGSAIFLENFPGENYIEFVNDMQEPNSCVTAKKAFQVNS